MTRGDYELCWRKGCNVFCVLLPSLVNRCVEICLPLLWPNLSTAVRTLETFLHPRALIRVVPSCCVTRPGGLVSEYRVFTWGRFAYFGTLPLVDRITQGTKLGSLTVYQESN